MENLGKNRKEKKRTHRFIPLRSIPIPFLGRTSRYIGVLEIPITRPRLLPQRKRNVIILLFGFAGKHVFELALELKRVAVRERI